MANIQLTLKNAEGLFMRAKAANKLDQFSDKFWEEFSHNRDLTYREAEKILESI